MNPPPLRRRTDHESTDPGSARALIVDDDADYRTYAAALVRRFGFLTTECADGESAVEELEHSAPFDILIIDYKLPRLSGVDLIRHIRQHPRHGEAYAIMLTGYEDSDLKVSALRLGFDDFILKSSLHLEIDAKLNAARRLVSRQRRLDATVRELYGMATRDELTGLINRRFFFSEADRILSDKTTINLIFLDLDDFKVINDTYGHLAGDRILHEIGTLFLARTRADDLIARFGGDEFVMLVQRLSPPEVETIASRIASEIGALRWVFGSEVISVSVTTGIACSSLMTDPTVTRLLSAGDRDLYKNKWLRKHPENDMSMYEYDSRRDAQIIELWDAEVKRRPLLSTNRDE